LAANPGLASRLKYDLSCVVLAGKRSGGDVIHAEFSLYQEEVYLPSVLSGIRQSASGAQSRLIDPLESQKSKGYDL
jgi:hypothetical protein